ncbi:MAG TPA: hypothetical protein VIK72_14615 [Clostridiaceae bacterium]
MFIRILRIIILVLIPISFVGIPLLQIFLSRKKHRWPGLILPTVIIIISIIVVLPGTLGKNITTIQLIKQIIAGILIINIPTITLLSIYFSYRKKFSNNWKIDKMKIQDLH